MSAVLFNTAKRILRERYGNRAFMMPNALKLEESVAETAKEVGPACLDVDRVIVPISSATIAAGVIKGFLAANRRPHFILHMGYSRSQDMIRAYIRSKVPEEDGTAPIELVDEGYEYKHKAREGDTPPFPCSPYYDLKAFRWWMTSGRAKFEQDGCRTLLWNIG